MNMMISSTISPLSRAALFTEHHLTDEIRTMNSGVEEQRKITPPGTISKSITHPYIPTKITDKAKMHQLPNLLKCHQRIINFPSR